MALCLGQKWGKPYATQCHSMPIYACLRLCKKAPKPLCYGALAPSIANTPAQSGCDCAAECSLDVGEPLDNFDRIILNKS